MEFDILMQQEVIDQLAWEPLLAGADITVVAQNNIVTLTGIVDTYAKKLAAGNAARKVASVKLVSENIQVIIPPQFRRSDAALAAAVLHALEWDTTIPHEKIKVTVDRGMVSLEGEVQWDYERTAARRAIENLAGIAGVKNYITIQPAITSGDVIQKIVAAFQRSAAIDSGKIYIDRMGSKIILTGKVRSFAELQEVTNIVWLAPGVRSVENNLELQQEEEHFF